MSFDFDEIRLGSSFIQVAPIVSVATGLQTFRSTHSLAAGGSQDFDAPAGDGVANLLKFAFNMLGTGVGQKMDLNQSNNSALVSNGFAGLPVSSIESTTGDLQVTFIRRKLGTVPASGINYAVEFSNDLVTWEVDTFATEIVTDIDSIFERVTLTDSDSGINRYFARLRISKL